VAYFANALNLVTKAFIEPPWTLPAPILMYLATGYDIRAAILAIITEFVIPGIIWFPFFKAWEKRVLEKEGG
jgi:PTS system cellobiose-specific IIC component